MTEAKLDIPPLSATSESTEMQGWQLTEDMKDFLNPEYNKKFSTEFEIGDNKLIMYGNPVMTPSPLGDATANGSHYRAT